MRRECPRTVRETDRDNSVAGRVKPAVQPIAASAARICVRALVQELLGNSLGRWHRPHHQLDALVRMSIRHQEAGASRNMVQVSKLEPSCRGRHAIGAQVLAVLEPN
jgi:hypothetical protein